MKRILILTLLLTTAAHAEPRTCAPLKRVNLATTNDLVHMSLRINGGKLRLRARCTGLTFAASFNEEGQACKGSYIWGRNIDSSIFVCKITSIQKARR